MGYTNIPQHDFYVWSREHGGCIMLTKYRDGKRVNWSSHCEGEYPIFDERAKAAVAQANTALARGVPLK